MLLLLPFSRRCEAEADYIGLLLMARACYDPGEAVRLWERMQAAAGRADAAPPEFLSTHPSHARRIDKIHAWLPEAEARFAAAGCAQHRAFAAARDLAGRWQV